MRVLVWEAYTFLLILRYVSMRLWEHIPTPFETAELVHAMLEQHGCSAWSLFKPSYLVICLSDWNASL